MTATLFFWILAAALALVCFAAILAPMLRGARPAQPRARYDAKVFRDQLREIDSDRARGLVTEAEARATGIEISRRLLASAADEAGPPDPSPRRLSRRAGTALVALLLLAGLGLYGRLGAPGLGDQPLATRLARAAAERANRPGQAEVEAEIARAAAPAGPRAAVGSPAGSPAAPGPRRDAAPGSGGEDAALVEKLKEVVEARPGDERGHRLLARALAGLRDWSGARAAQGELIGILGDRASADDYAEWAELMILATNGYVSPEAEAALGRALERDPSNKLARYYSGLTLLRSGRPDLTYRLWSGLIAEGPPDAPWIAPIRSQIGEVARMAGLPPPPGAAAPGAGPEDGEPGTGAPGPDAADIEAAGRMAPEERQSMVLGMVERLAARLDAEGGPVEDWARLIRAQGVLGGMDAAQASWDKARQDFASDPAALATLAGAAREAGLTAR